MAISLVILGIATSIGSVVLIGVRDASENTSAGRTTAYNLSDKAALGIGEYGNWFKILVIVGVAAVILGLIFIAFKPQAQSGTY